MYNQIGYQKYKKIQQVGVNHLTFYRRMNYEKIISIVFGFAGFYQYRTEEELWCYYNESTSKAFWAYDSTHPLYTFTGSTVKDTASIGERVKFIAKWNQS